VSLTGRLSAFFLTAMAVVLVGFSVTLYVLARQHLLAQLDARLDAAVGTLTAALEFKPGGLEWEPKERRVTLGQGKGADEVRWLIGSDTGEVVARSPNLDGEDVAARMQETARDHQSRRIVTIGAWRVQTRHIQAEPGEAAPGQAGNEAPGDRVYSALVLTGAISRAPVDAMLNGLAWTLAGISAGLWTLAALLGRRLCRRALVPVTTMATAARAMKVADMGQRLPNPRTGDELEGFSTAFNELLDRLQEAFERQRRFTGDASHQLRTPLTAMLGQIEVCLRRERAGMEYERVLALVHGQAEQLRHLVEMLLFLARADGEAKLPNLESVELVSWLEEYSARWTGHARAADLHVKSLVERPAHVKVQPPLLAQLLDNLLDNACKYSEPGSPIQLELSRMPGRVKLSVQDAGAGIAEHDLAHIFEPFYRCSEARRRGTAGVGLGLSVAQRIATAFGGIVTACSEPGKGSRFTVELPEVEARQTASSLAIAPEGALANSTEVRQFAVPKTRQA
jgi:two-component system OmpR family sensor kinase